MKNVGIKTFCVLCCICNLFSISIFGQSYLYKGNTHTHTTKGDGKLPPIDVVNAYKAAGYHFLFITDEDKITPTDAFSDSVFLCFNGEEAIIDKHISCLNIKTPVAPTSLIPVIDSTYAQGGFAVINHPMRGTHEVYARDIIDIENLKFIEIYNGKSEKDGHHDDQSLWDSLLTAGKLIYGIAADDFHEMKHISKGWIMVQADTLQKDSIISAIEKGRFYSSTGIYISELFFNDSIIKIKTTNASKIEFIGNDREYLQTNNSDTALYRITGDEGYIRVEASSFNKKAWTQVLFWDKTFEGLPPIIHSSDIFQNEGKKNFELKVYPNPARQNINVNINSIKPVKAELIILNVTGNIVYRNFLELNENITRIPINLEILNPGIYFLTVTTINFTKPIKFMISH